MASALFIGTRDGLYASRALRNMPHAAFEDEIGAARAALETASRSGGSYGAGAAPRRVASLDHIIKLKADSRQHSLFVLTGGASGRLFEFSLTELLAGLPAVVTMIPHSRGVSTFDCGWVGAKFFVCAASDDKVLVYTVRSDGSYREQETLVLPSRISAITLTQYGVLVGTEEVEATPAQVMFFSFEAERTFLYDPVYVVDRPGADAGASSSSTGAAGASTAPLLLASSTLTESWSDLVEFHAPERVLASRPIDILVTPYGVVLCFARLGVLLTPDGRVEHEIAWSGEAVAFAVAGAFFAVYYRTFLEVRTLASGALALLFLASDTVDGELLTPELFHLQPVVAVNYSSPEAEALVRPALQAEAAAGAAPDDEVSGSGGDLEASAAVEPSGEADAVDVNALTAMWETKFGS
ncbi:uncharacterized protein AMSG_11844 [Thecamonas trahens ATCC 50062]|uniref:CNH domain-containing protein n=1 Tax=Thecamonas trahens ATCC 50062 TaxID=461836 RepID=A0A0L0DA22_THETB|nr:hypothetical protein AMSG_11844 [Thecamonas trahens ATCC 50062]KNC49065.1 hypothetical protein AMSG_11844 [Thecamonas trahens ATCC 50062]|eukprot:XP_013758223.1 hypothetical protein AMSG_11844 [Thecamonas trahens ATCC 50062]